MTNNMVLKPVPETNEDGLFLVFQDLFNQARFMINIAPGVVYDGWSEGSYRAPSRNYLFAVVHYAGGTGVSMDRAEARAREIMKRGY